MLYLPGAPGAVHYPFLYPLFLAALWGLVPAFPANVVVFKAANAALLAICAALLVLYLDRRMAQRTWRLAVMGNREIVLVIGMDLADFHAEVKKLESGK